MALVNYKIADNVILRQYTNTPAQEFFKINNQSILANEDSWNKTVWITGEFANHLNKIYSNECLVPYPIEKPTYKNCTLLEVMLKQHYRLDDLFGLYLTITNSATGEVVFSQMLFEDDFHVTSDKLLIDGSFWMTSARIYIPGTVSNSTTLVATINEVDLNSIDSTSGKLNIEITSGVPLQPDKLLSQHIQTQLTLDENFYLRVAMYTPDNISLEQALHNEFGILDNQLAEFSISHDISYGNDIVGWQSITVKNNNDKYGLIVLGLNMLPYTNLPDKSLMESSVEIMVQTNIQYNNTEPMQRTNTLTTDIKTVLNPLIEKIAKLEKPTSLYPVEVKVEQVINQTVVEANTEREVVQVYQPVYIEMIKQNFVVDKKNITFETLHQPAYLIINGQGNDEEQSIFSKQTSEGIYYFDITDIVPPSKETTYRLMDETQSYLIGEGMVLLTTTEEIVSTDTM